MLYPSRHRGGIILRMPDRMSPVPLSENDIYVLFQDGNEVFLFEKDINVDLWRIPLAGVTCGWVSVSTDDWVIVCGATVVLWKNDSFKYFDDLKFQNVIGMRQVDEYMVEILTASGNEDKAYWLFDVYRETLTKTNEVYVRPMEEKLPIEEIFGKTITNIYCCYGQQDGWLDTADCYIELDGKLLIEIPYGNASSVYCEEKPAGAETIFSNLNKNADGVYQLPKRSTLWRIKEKLGISREVWGYNVVNHVIVDCLRLDTSLSTKVFFVLDNGWLITDQYMAPHGTGRAGLHYYASPEDVKANNRGNLVRFSDKTKLF